MNLNRIRQVLSRLRALKTLRRPTGSARSRRKGLALLRCRRAGFGARELRAHRQALQAFRVVQCAVGSE